MSNKAKHIETTDILGIFIPIGISLFTLFLTHSALFIYYLAVSLFRLLIMILQMIIVRSKDTPERKFIKERRLCRFVGLTFIFVIAVYSLMLLWIATGLKSEFFLDHPWTIVIYFVYALYKLITGFIYLKKSRMCWSPYREIISNLSFLDAMATSLNAISLTYAVTTIISDHFEHHSLLTLIIIIIIISLVMGLKMIKSRRVPNLMR